MTSPRLCYAKKILFSDVSNALPNVVDFDIGKISGCDIYICALGFEERTTSAAMTLAAGSLNVGDDVVSLVGEYKTNAADNRKNKDELFLRLSAFSSLVDTVDADNPGEVHSKIRDLICRRGAGGDISVVFDISVASTPFILSVMAALAESDSKVRLDVIYTAAQDYFPKRDDYLKDKDAVIAAACEHMDATFSDYGSQTPVPHELYPGIYHDSRPDYILAMPSYRTNRLLQCLTSVSDQIITSPEKSIFWILGASPDEHFKWRQGLQREMVEKMVWDASTKRFSSPSEIGAEIKAAECSTLDYRESTGIIISKADEHLVDNISIIPMGSKMQLLGASLALKARSEIRVLYARPIMYVPSQYSEGVGKCYMIQFSNLQEIIGRLKRIGSMEYDSFRREMR